MVKTGFGHTVTPDFFYWCYGQHSLNVLSGLQVKFHRCLVGIHTTDLNAKAATLRRSALFPSFALPLLLGVSIQMVNFDS